MRINNKYAISKEFFPYNHFSPPLSKKMIRFSQKYMRAPGFIWRDKELTVKPRRINGFGAGEIELYVMSPRALEGKLPCLILFHGGGFVFEGYSSHYRLATIYAKYGRCIVVYVKYRLAPDHPFPVPQEDCYAAYEWICSHADELCIDKERIAVTGDSAGGTLAVTTSILADKRNPAIRPMFQMLIYPWLDSRNTSDSFKRYTDTPMWNSMMSKKVTPMTDPEPDKVSLYLRSPIELDSFKGMPPAYIEVAEFDCLHDDGVNYAKRLKDDGIEVKLYETKGTMHGFDTKLKAPTTKKWIKNRIRYIRKMFWGMK